MRAFELKHGDRLSIKDRRLRLTNLAYREDREYPIEAFPFDTVTVGAHGGSLTFDAIRWLTSVGASIVGFGFDGRPDWEAMPASPPPPLC